MRNEPTPAQPFRYRNGWRAQVTLKNGNRPHEDFDTHADAKAWIADMLDDHVRNVTLNRSDNIKDASSPAHQNMYSGIRRLKISDEE